MLLVDTVKGKIIEDDELKSAYAARLPYGEWLDQHLVTLKDLPIPNKKAVTLDSDYRARLQKAFAYSYEDIKDTILPMARSSAEPTAAMGDDLPRAVLSEKHQPLFNYFKQMFAQVTNPPIDAIREESVTDTTVYVGSDGNLLEDRAENCNVLQINNPILTNVDLLKIKYMDRPGFKVETVSLLYYKQPRLDRALDHLFVACDRAYKNGANILILSDRGVDENHVAIPSLLAVAALEQHLIRTKKRTAVSVILESAEPRNVHHFATLLGYGARAVNPYLAHECIRQAIHEGLLDKDYTVAVTTTTAPSSMALSRWRPKWAFPPSSPSNRRRFSRPSASGRTSWTAILPIPSPASAVWVWRRLPRASSITTPTPLTPWVCPTTPLWSPMATSGSAAAARRKTICTIPRSSGCSSNPPRNRDYEMFQQYTHLVDDESTPHTLRGLLTFATPESGPIPIEEVEPVSEIVKTI